MDSSTGGETNLKSPLQLNTVTSLIVQGLIVDNNGVDLDLSIPRDEYDKPAMNVSFEDNRRCLSYIPTGTPTSLEPPDDNFELVLKLGACLSQGERHLVFKVTPLNGEPWNIPKLVLKVALEHQGRHLGNEAAMYKRLQALQGSVIPRCYGFFRRYVNLMEYMVKPWGPEVTYPRELDEFDLPNERATLTVLLLEQVGGHVSCAPVPKGLKRALYDMDKELFNYGVYFGDWRYDNVVYAPKSPPGLPSLPSPLLNRVFKYRLIDLEDAVVTNIKAKLGHRQDKDRINWILTQMENGWCY
ncbi:hypothetical protein C8Q74DRAFT_1372599 [Fomes fomentarius]|nr:hypothetical protein C8Q74DRAFT_1372599 [Fomes fomentarius]